MLLLVGEVVQPISQARVGGPSQPKQYAFGYLPCKEGSYFTQGLEAFGKTVLWAKALTVGGRLS